MTDAEDEKNPDVIPQGKKAEKLSSGVSSSAHYGDIKNYTTLCAFLIIIFSTTPVTALNDDADSEWADSTVNSYVSAEELPTHTVNRDCLINSFSV